MKIKVEQVRSKSELHRWTECGSSSKRQSRCQYVCLSKAEGRRVCMLNSKVGRLFGLNLIKRSVQILNQEATEEKGKRELIVS